MKKWLRAMNPLMKPRGMAEAQWAAQTMAFALALSFLGGIPGSVWLAMNPGWFIDVGMQQGAGDPSAENFEAIRPFLETLMPIGFAVSFAVTGVFYAVLAWVQWRQMTRWIPIVWLAFFTYGLMMMLVQRGTGAPQVIQIGPAWMWGLSQACSVAATVIALASLRGAIMLHRLRREP